MINTLGSIILLNGHGSVGKTSISSCLEKLFLDDAVFIGFDNEILWPHAKKEAVKLGLWNDNIPVEQQQKILMECRYKIIIEKNWLDFVQEFNSLARLLVEKHRYVILDTVIGIKDVDIDNGQDLFDFTQKMQGVDVFSVLVYAPPSVHAQYLVERNKLPGYHNKRPVVSSMNDFFYVYAPATSDYVVDILTQQEIENALTILRNYLTQQGEQESFINAKVSEIRELYCNLFFLTQDDNIAIAPSFVHDLIVDTGKLSSQQCAQLIYERFFTR